MEKRGKGIKFENTCQRCEAKFLGRFGQKYCSANCRSGQWYRQHKSAALKIDINTETESTKTGISILVDDGNCPFCKGQLYTPAGQKEIIKCENINLGCNGYWQ